MDFSKILFVFGYIVSNTKTQNNNPALCPWNPYKATVIEKVSYVGAQLWKCLIDTDKKQDRVLLWEQSLLLQNWGINEGNRTDVFIESKHIFQMTKNFKDNNIDALVHVSNFQKWIDEQNPPLKKLKAKLHRLTWKRYHRLADIDSYLDYLSATYGKICSLHVIGHSVENRPLRVLKISNGRRGNKALWIDGGIHAREWISPATVTYIINHILKNWSKRGILQNVDWYFLPVLNPDGYEYSHTHDRLWRKNRRFYGSCYGTDLNRNFGYAWGQSGSSSCPCHDDYSGPRPFSEPESEAVRNFIESTRHYWEGFLTFHSFGQIIFYQGYDLKKLANSLAKKMEHVNGVMYATVPLTNEPTSGGSNEWAKMIMKIKYAFSIELRDLGNRGFILPYWNIVPSGKEGVAAVMRIIKKIK
ncbi:hypothetical protein FQR65_LT01407 [Abscondita terminalis]|nr:hypothetical protein FQR65_LT01407 [Abscondita terminalis]